MALKTVVFPLAGSPIRPMRIRAPAAPPATHADATAAPGRCQAAGARGRAQRDGASCEENAPAGKEKGAGVFPRAPEALGPVRSQPAAATAPAPTASGTK